MMHARTRTGVRTYSPKHRSRNCVPVPVPVRRRVDLATIVTSPFGTVMTTIDLVILPRIDQYALRQMLSVEDWSQTFPSLPFPVIVVDGKHLTPDT